VKKNQHRARICCNCIRRNVLLQKQGIKNGSTTDYTYTFFFLLVVIIIIIIIAFFVIQHDMILTGPTTARAAAGSKILDHGTVPGAIGARECKHAVGGIRGNLFP
jgi:hypothetical protein